MRTRKRPIHKGIWHIEVHATFIEVSDSDGIKTLASKFWDTDITLDATPYFFDGNSKEKDRETVKEKNLELINPSPVSKEIKGYGSPGVRSIMGYIIDRETLAPGEEKFLQFYLRKIVPACIPSNKKGVQKGLRHDCIKALYANEELQDFIKNVVLPGEDPTKPSAILKLFNGAFSIRTIETDLDELRQIGEIPSRKEVPANQPSSKEKGKKKHQEKNGEEPPITTPPTPKKEEEYVTETSDEATTNIIAELDNIIHSKRNGKSVENGEESTNVAYPYHLKGVIHKNFGP